MWCLESQKGRVFPVATLPAVVGSAAGAQVLLRHPSVADRHAHLSVAEDGSLLVEAIEDAVVGVDRKRVRRARLRGGETLVLGRVALLVIAPAGGVSPPARPPTENASEADAPAPRAPAPRRERADEIRPRTRAAPTAGGGASDGGVLRQRGDRPLQFQRRERRGPLDVDLSQLSPGARLGVIAGLVAVGVAIAIGIGKLVSLTG